MTNEDQPAKKIVEVPQPLGVYAAELFERGGQYRTAVIRLAAQEGTPPYSIPYPIYFLLSHSLELYLKAFLAAKGMSKKSLRETSIRHSPAKLLTLAQAKSLPPVDFLPHLAVQIEEMNSKFDFRYPTGYNLDLPVLDLCLPVLEQLHQAIEPIVGSAFVDAKIRWAEETRLQNGTKFMWSD